uniref:RRM domain-containing protein n=1 Tax=Octopus bimaculoides TaxID=37653 RepID=A0A0L8FYR1_OCTBM
MSKSPLRSYEFVSRVPIFAKIKVLISSMKVRDVRLITDNKTRRSKGIAYVEFVDVECVNKALALTGQRLLGVPIMVQPSQAEKNRAANATATLQKGTSGPMRLYVGSLHFNITEEMLRGIFEPFGKIDDIKLIKDHESGRLQGYGFITFHDAEDAKKALEQLNGFELAGRPMKVGHVTERTAENQVASILDSDDMDRAGIDLGATRRLQLMAKLAEGTGFQIPQYVANALNMNSSGDTATPPPTPAPNLSTQSPTPMLQASAAAAAAAALVNLTSTAPVGVTSGAASGSIAGGGGGGSGGIGGVGAVGTVGSVGSVGGGSSSGTGSGTTTSQPTQAANGPPIPTQCFMLANMFDPSSESKVNWDQEIRDDVIEECNKHGGVVHIYVDKASVLGNVYVKCPNIAAAVASVNALHGRYFAGKLITAAYVPLPNYHALFPEAVRANQLLLPSTQALQYSYGTALYPGMPPNISR